MMLHHPNDDMVVPPAIDSHGRQMRGRNFKMSDFPAATEIVKGYFNSVFKARHRQFGKDLALKLLHRIGDDRSWRVSNRLMEINSHPNILKPIGLIEAELSPRGYITEWIDTTLDKVIYNNSEDPSLPHYSIIQAIEICEQICNGLIYLYQEQLFNISISPKRVFISNDLKTVKMSGFASLQLEFTEERCLVARFDEDEDEAFQTHKLQTTANEKLEILECLPYVDPQSIFDTSIWEEFNFLYTDCDIYSVAITTWETVAREKPYGILDYERAYDLYTQIIQTSHRPDCELLDDDVRVVLERAWRTETEERPTLQVFCKDLETLKKNRLRLEEEKHREGQELMAKAAMVHRPNKEGEYARGASGYENTTKRRSSVLLGEFGEEQRFLKREIISKRHLGVGVEGVIYVGEHAVFGNVAVKILKSDNNFKELRMTLQLRPHPNIVIIYGFLFEEEAETIPSGYVMEAMHTSLNKVIHRKPDDHSLPEYSTEEAVEIMQKICRGVHFLHQQDIFHRDLKPENVLTSNDLKTIKLCDFGMSTTLNSTLNMGKGTIIYMAPEVMIGEEDITWKYNAKCDVYSAAICFWELLHKQIPFGEVRGYGKMIDGVVRYGMRPSLEYSSVTEVMKEILRRAWHSDPEQRPTISELNIAISQCF